MSLKLQTKLKIIIVLEQRERIRSPLRSELDLIPAKREKPAPGNQPFFDLR